MKTLLIIALASLLLGCNSTPEDKPIANNGSNSGSATDGNSPSTTSTGGTPVSSSSASTGTTSTTTGSVDPKPDPTQNPNRVFQLKDLKVATVTANGHRIQAWLMDTAAKREEGMMWLKDPDVKENQGMLFVFPSEETNMGFWMDNTILPLDIIFIGKNKRALNIQRGKPFDQTSLPASGPAMYVLELKQGVSQKYGIKSGTLIDFPSSIKAEN